jgi:hypothetical protein
VQRAIGWLKEEPFGVEFAEVTLAENKLAATGVAIGTEPVVYRLDYVLETGTAFVTSRLALTAHGDGWLRRLELSRDESGVWSADFALSGEQTLDPPSADIDALAGALDCDLGLSPLTNSMPVLRHGLLDGGGPIDLRMAWVSVPDLAVTVSGQRYTFVRKDGDHSIVRYEDDSGFTADITFDRDGLVLDYPGIAKRLVSP